MGAESDHLGEEPNEFDEERIRVLVVSGGNVAGRIGSIKINGIEYAPNVRGLNIVVYNMNTHRVLDAVAFDAHEPNLTVFR